LKCIEYSIYRTAAKAFVIFCVEMDDVEPISTVHKKYFSHCSSLLIKILALVKGIYGHGLRFRELTLLARPHHPLS